MLKEEIIDIMNQPSLASQLPYKFSNNKAQINGVSVECSRCNSIISEDMILGRFEQINDQSVKLDANAVCFKCRLFTPIDARFSDSGDVLYKVEDGWFKGKFISSAGRLKRIFQSIIASF